MRLTNVKIEQPYYKQGWVAEIHLCEKPYDLYKYLDRDLDIDIKIHREKRSLNANAYFHVLVDKIAEASGVSHNEIHNQLIADYGQMDEDVKSIILADEIPWQRLTNLHLRPTNHVDTLDNGKLYRVYIVMRGSHTYDTKEMARLIDGTVSEAKEMGIETLPPKELERMKQLWKAS
jgi:hypothetical protein